LVIGYRSTFPEKRGQIVFVKALFSLIKYQNYSTLFSLISATHIDYYLVALLCGATHIFRSAGEETGSFTGRGAYLFSFNRRAVERDKNGP
jgi:hypothetical protein